MAWMPFHPDMGAILTIKGLVRGGIFSSLFVAVVKKGLAHLLTNHYEVRTDLVCENIPNLKNKTKIYPINKESNGHATIFSTPSSVTNNWSSSLIPSGPPTSPI